MFFLPPRAFLTVLIALGLFFSIAKITFSIPIYFLFNLLATIPVVPLPLNGSKIKSFSSVIICKQDEEVVFEGRALDEGSDFLRRGDVYYADLRPVIGSEQGGTRPVLIVQNDTGNRHSPTVIAAAITSQTGKARLPTHISIAGGSVGLSKDSVILLEQIRTIDKRRLRVHMGRLDDMHMSLVDNAIAVSFGLNENRTI